jgi:hypothetical protein
VEPGEQAQIFVATARQRQVLTERLRSLRADLAGDRWSPLPEQRALRREIAQLQGAIEQLGLRLTDPAAIAAAAQALIDDAVDELVRDGAVDGADALAAAVVARLVDPDASSPQTAGAMLLRDLPGVAELLTVEAVRQRVCLLAHG